MKISKGKKKTAIRTVIYGTEGIGKSTLASHWPHPLWLDTEAGSNQLDVDRVEGIETWSDLIATMREFLAEPGDYKTLVLDTVDKTETMLIEDICKQAGKDSIEEFGFGKGYTVVQERIIKELLMMMDKVIAKGIHVVIIAHTAIRTITPPDSDPYDHYELKTTKKVSPVIKEWADMVLFCNYKISVVKSGDSPTAKSRATGSGKRMMYTTHKPSYDAKNRYGLPDELPMAYSAIASVIDGAIERKPDKNVIDITRPNDGIVDGDTTETHQEQLTRKLATYGITPEQLDAWMISTGRGALADASDTMLASMAGNIDILVSQITGGKE